MIYFLFPATFLALMFLGVNPLNSLFVTTSLFVVGYMMNERRKRIKLLSTYNHLIDDVYIISKHPDQNWIAAIPRFDHEKKIIIKHVPYDKLFDTVEETKELLEKSGNPFYMSKNNIANLQAKGKKVLTADEAVEVKYFLFQDGIRRGETWDEFCLFCEEQILNDIQPRHENMKMKKNNWYEVNYHNKRAVLTPTN